MNDISKPIPQPSERTLNTKTFKRFAVQFSRSLHYGQEKLAYTKAVCRAVREIKLSTHSGTKNRTTSWAKHRIAAFMEELTMRGEILSGREMKRWDGERWVLNVTDEAKEKLKQTDLYRPTKTWPFYARTAGAGK